MGEIGNLVRGQNQSVSELGAPWSVSCHLTPGPVQSYDPRPANSADGIDLTDLGAGEQDVAWRRDVLSDSRQYSSSATIAPLHHTDRCRIAHQDPRSPQLHRRAIPLSVPWHAFSQGIVSLCGPGGRQSTDPGRGQSTCTCLSHGPSPIFYQSTTPGRIRIQLSQCCGQRVARAASPPFRCIAAIERVAQWRWAVHSAWYPVTGVLQALGDLQGGAK